MNAHAQQPATVRTACPYCGVGCGVLATPSENGGVAIAGDPMHPANFGALCSKGAALGETLGLEGRLLHPMVRRDGALARTDWGAALETVAAGFRQVIKQHGPDAVAFYLSGQLLTEDYYVANKLMKGFIGSANVDTNSRLCMASSVAGHRRAFGADTVPGVYADLDEADLIVLVGSNAAWCHPVLFRRMAANMRERGARLVVIDPRRTATAEEADLFLPIAPGSDTALFCGLLAHLVEAGALDDAFIEDHTTGFAEAIARAREIAPDADATAKATGLARADVVSFFGAFRATSRVDHVLFARRQPVGAGHRQGQRHHQLPSRDRPHRQARHGTVLAHRSAQRDGRARGRRPRQPARRAYGLFARRDRLRAPLLEGAEHGDARGPQGRADVRGRRGAAASRRCG